METGRNGWAYAPLPFATWWEHPVAMSSSVWSKCLCAADVAPGGLIVDPFAGLGSTAAGACARGLRSVGIESNPLWAEVAALKLTERRDTDGLREAADAVTQDLPAVDIGGEHELLRRCFAPDVLATLVALRDRVAGHPSIWRGHLRLALLASLRDHAQVEVGWVYVRPGRPRYPRSVDPAKALRDRVTAMAAELDAHPRAWSALGRVERRDARNGLAWRGLVRAGQADAAITSPPYFNNVDYVDASRLELTFDGAWDRGAAQLRASMVAASTHHAAARRAVQAHRELRRWPHTAGRCRALSGALRNRRLSGDGSSKPYDEVLPMYLRDLGLALTGVAGVLAPGGTAAIVVGDSAPNGVHVDVPHLLAELGGEVGLKFEGVETLRRRGDLWPSKPHRHDLELKESLVVLRRPKGRTRQARRTAPAIVGERPTPEPLLPTLGGFRRARSVPQ